MKKGISLVALVVTIIVLIILTGAVVATFMEGGIIDRAKEAVMKSDCTTLIETYNVAYNTAKIDEITGTGEKVDRIAILEKVVNELELKGFDFSEKTVEYTGDNDEIKEWINSNFIFIGLEEAGYILSTVNGTTYLTGIKMEDNTILTTAEDILENLPIGYSIIDIIGNEIGQNETVSTGCKIINGEESCITIVVKGNTFAEQGETGILLDDLTTMFVYYLLSEEEMIEDFFGRKYTDAEIIAIDMNNDGVISQEDMDILDQLLADIIYPDILINAQKDIISKVPTIQIN